MYEFNFDEWADLYNNSPEEFERKRAEILEAEILKSPVKNRAILRILQLECDAIHSTTLPLEGSEKMLELAVKKLKELRLPLTQLRAICEDP